MENIMYVIGLVAAFCTTLSFVPQAVKALKTQDTKSISLGMYLIFTFGTSLWIVYGVLRMDYIIILANVISTCLALLILIAKIRHG